MSKNKMKIHLVNFSENRGGAARACHRLFKALPAQTQYYVVQKNSDHPRVQGPQNYMESLQSSIFRIMDKLVSRPFRVSGGTLFSAGLFGSVWLFRKVKTGDIVHLHWVQEGCLGISQIARLRVPVLITLHDTWPLYAGDHYDNNQRGVFRHFLTTYKTWIWSSKNICFVCPSRWMLQEFEKSTLAKKHRAMVIPNCIDTQIFAPRPATACRDLLSLPREPKLVLFGAMSPTEDDRKGYKLLLEALNYLKQNNQRDDIELVIVGTEKQVSHLPYKTYYLGNIQDEVAMAALMSAVDLTLLPSRQENLSCFAMESLSCGTPVVAFDIGGNADLISHKENGFLAEAFSSEDFAAGILWCLGALAKSADLKSNARKHVMSNFTLEVISEKHQALYNELLK